MSALARRPICLLADSQLLFWKQQGRLFLHSALADACSHSVRAAYVGAANKDSPEYYDIFTAAMDGIGIRDCRFIRSAFTPTDQAFLEGADLILLAGGDVELGWRIFNSTSMAQAIRRRFHEGAALIGVSAGAMHLGRHGVIERDDLVAELIDTFDFFPFVVGVHDERRDWAGLRKVIRLLEGSVTGVGIPSGGGLLYFPDGTLQPIRHPVSAFSAVAGEVRESLLLPTESTLR